MRHDEDADPRSSVPESAETGGKSPVAERSAGPSGSGSPFGSEAGFLRLLARRQPVPVEAAPGTVSAMSAEEAGGSFPAWEPSAADPPLATATDATGEAPLGIRLPFPARVPWPWVRVLLPALVLGLLFTIDVPFAAWTRVHFSRRIDDFLLLICYLGGAATPLLVAGLLYPLSVFLGRPRLARIARLVVLGSALAGAVVLIAKPVIGRHETFLHPNGIPIASRAPNGSGHWGRFPSGHASVSFAMARAIAIEAPPLAPAAYALAVLVGADVVHDGSHSLSDVFAGAWLGILSASWMARWLKKWKRRRDASRAPAAEGAVAAPSSWRVIAAILAIAFPLLFFRLGAWGFFDPDEGRHAEIPYEMIVRGDFVTPTLNYVPYLEKPPLFYWLVAGAYQIFGRNEWAGRLVPALCWLMSLGIAFVLGRRMFGHRAGLIATLVLATTVMWTALGNLLIIDTLLASLVFLALASWWLGHTSSGRQRTIWDAVFWIATALGVLTKGPVAAVLALGTIVLYALACRQWKAVLRPSWLAWAPLAVLMAAPWFVLVAERNPGFNRFFWYGQHIGRFLGLAGNREHDNGLLYYLFMLPLMLLPWTVFLPGAILSGWRKVLPARSEKQRALVFLSCGIVLIVLFFSVSTSKLPQYVLPVFPLVAVALGGWLEWAGRHPEAAWGGSLWRSPMRIAAALGGAALLAGAAACVVAGPGLLRRAEALGPGRALVSALVLVTFALAVMVAHRRRDQGMLVAAAAGGVVVLVLWVKMLAGDMAPNHYCKSLVNYLRPGLGPETTLVASDSYLPTLGFYTGKRVPIVGRTGEVGFGLEQIPEGERKLWYDGDPGRLRARLAVETPVYAFVRDHATAGRLLPGLGPGVEEIVWNERRSVLGNAAAARLTPPLPGGLLTKRRALLP